MADNRQFTDHNEIGGVNVYLEDKKLAESPEKSTVASTDYVLLKDTEGVPQKISKANMMGVVKDALADLLKSNDLGTSVTNVPALNASAFGSATLANFASLLGTTEYIGYVTNILEETLSANYGSRIVIGMTDNSYATGVPVSTGNTYGIFVFLPCNFNGVSHFNIILYVFFGQDLKFSRFFIKSSWGAEGEWKEISLT